MFSSAIGQDKIKIIQLDDASDPSNSSRNASKLVEEENVDILIGTSSTPATAAMAAVAVAKKVPMIAVSPMPNIAPGEGGPWVISIPQPPPLMAKAVVDRMKASGVKTVGYIGYSDSWGDLVYDGLTKAAEPAGIKVVTNERYARADSSVTAQALKIVAAHPDAVMNGGSGTPGALPLIALKERGYTGPTFGMHALINPDFIRVGGAAAEGIICPTGPVVVAEQLPESNPIRAVALQFREAYQKANGAPTTDAFSAYSFDAWLIFLDAAKRAYELDRKHVFHSWSAQAQITPMTILASEGSYVWDGEGRKLLDFSSQMVNTNIGHQHPKVAEIQEWVMGKWAWARAILAPAGGADGKYGPATTTLVATLQQRLNSQAAREKWTGWTPLDVDDKWGPATEAAAKSKSGFRKPAPAPKPPKEAPVTPTPYRRYPAPSKIGTDEFWAELEAIIAEEGYTINCGPSDYKAGRCAPGKHPHSRTSRHFAGRAIDPGRNPRTGEPVSAYEQAYLSALGLRLRDLYPDMGLVLMRGPGDHEDHLHVQDKAQITPNSFRPDLSGAPAGVILYGMRGDHVKALQRSIGVTPDGVFGIETFDAVRAAQSKAGIAVDGIAGPATTEAVTR